MEFLIMMGVSLPVIVLPVKIIASRLDTTGGLQEEMDKKSATESDEQ